jgi:hypothetical protein
MAVPGWMAGARHDNCRKVALRVHSGDTQSCLHLQPDSPTLLKSVKAERSKNLSAYIEQAGKN